MAKLQRKSAKLFASEATAAAGGLAQFGSLAAGSPNYSTDPDVIQALDAYKEGWSSAVLGTKSPALEDRNALDYLLSYQQAYIMQHGIPEWLDTETYYENSYVIDSNGELRVSVIDNNTGHDPIEDEGGQYWGYAGARGAGKQIGEVYYSQSSSASDNKGALPLFTGELISNADNLYPQFYAWVLSHTELCKTQAEYDTAISTYGECPYYVLNTSNKTIRLPKLVNFIKNANATDGIKQSLAGLPNIVGTHGSGEKYDDIAATGAFYKQSWTNRTAGDGTNNPHAYGFDASRCSEVYGRSNTVTPAHTTLYPWVCAYNGAAPASVAQAAQFQAALSSKADVDLANCTKPYVTDTYSNGSSWYRVWSDGWCEQGDVTQENVTITFLKEFSDTNYFINGITPVSGGNFTVTFDSKNTSSIILRVGDDTSGTSLVTWYACGYIN